MQSYGMAASCKHFPGDGVDERDCKVNISYLDGTMETLYPAEHKNLDYDLINKDSSESVIFDTKNIIKEVPDTIRLYNYGNLHELKN